MGFRSVQVQFFRQELRLAIGIAPFKPT